MARQRAAVGRKSLRAAVACRRCNGRKVKCTASVQLPCAGCRSAGVACELIDSQRGKYPRRRRDERLYDGQAEAALEAVVLQDGEAVNTAPPASFCMPSATQPTLPRDHADASEVVLAPAGQIGGGCAGPYGPTQASHGLDLGHDDGKPTDETVYLGEPFSLTYVVQDVLAPVSGESQYLTRRRLHFPLVRSGGPSAAADGPSAADAGKVGLPADGLGNKAEEVEQQTRRLSGRQMTNHRQQQHLQALGLWSYPPAVVCGRLLAAYWTLFHPSFPIVDRAGFAAAVERQEASLLLLSAVLLAAVTVCADDELPASTAASTGPSADVPDTTTQAAQNTKNTRNTLRRLHYQQAKALYDADLEPDRFDAIAAVFHMSFWWADPDEEKDTWHWLGIASSMAQSQGMHRSLQFSGACPRKVSAWRRLWWSIRIRDLLVSSSIGRPQHFSAEYCDVELPTVDDVREAIGAPNGGSGDDIDDEALLYFVEMAKLSVNLNDILMSRYAPGNIASDGRNREALETSLDAFQAQLPTALQYRGISASRHGLFSVNLLMALDYATILLCRPAQRANNGQVPPSQWGNSRKAVAAANEITRAMEDILSADVAQICQIHTFHALFNALAMHIWGRLTASDVGRELAENRCRTCLLGLSVLKETWPVAGWVHRLFLAVLVRLRHGVQHSGPLRAAAAAPAAPMAPTAPMAPIPASVTAPVPEPTSVLEQPRPALALHTDSSATPACYNPSSLPGTVCDDSSAAFTGNPAEGLASHAYPVQPAQTARSAKTGPPAILPGEYAPDLFLDGAGQTAAPQLDVFDLLRSLG